mmetsp:Transcript_60156/g.175782  ORF Transcript_60156/g.175782 Transcript_60156/m.175782 type:complete len:211 (-) Transcript_60156:555-1187(-)
MLSYCLCEEEAEGVQRDHKNRHHPEQRSDGARHGIDKDPQRAEVAHDPRDAHHADDPRHADDAEARHLQATEELLKQAGHDDETVEDVPLAVGRLQELPSFADDAEAQLYGEADREEQRDVVERLRGLLRLRLRHVLHLHAAEERVAQDEDGHQQLEAAGGHEVRERRAEPGVGLAAVDGRPQRGAADPAGEGPAVQRLRPRELQVLGVG